MATLLSVVLDHVQSVYGLHKTDWLHEDTPTLCSSMFIIACSTWNFNHCKFLTSLNRVILADIYVTNNWHPCIDDWCHVARHWILVVYWILTPGIKVPSIAKHIFNMPHISQKLSFNLSCPDNGTCYWRHTYYLWHTVSFQDIRKIPGQLSMTYHT